MPAAVRVCLLAVVAAALAASPARAQHATLTGRVTDAATHEPVAGVLVTVEGTSLVAEHQFHFPVVRFPEAKLKYLYRMQVVPVTAVLDSTGRVLYAHVGAVTDTAIVDSVLAALRYQQPRAAAQADTVKRRRN